MYLARRQLISIYAVGAFLLSANLFSQGIILGITGLVIFVFGLTTIIASIIQKKIEAQTQVFAWSMLVSLLYLIIANSLLYYIHAITPVTSLFVLWLPIITGFRFISHLELPQISWKKEEETTQRTFVFFVLIEIALIAMLFLGSTDGLLRSPWHALSPQFFILYALATGLLLMFVSKSKNTITRFISIAVHFFATYSVAAIIYKLGFGFDAFIHRATEQWIQIFGFIHPKQPYYIGQYSFVVWLSNVTAIPLFYIDVYLVPVLASLTLPAIIPATLKHGFAITKKFAHPLALFVIFLPFLFFHLTTPYNLALLISLITIFSTILYLQKSIPFHIPILLSITAISIHPLIGAPIVLFVFYAFLIQKYNEKKAIKSLLLSLIFDIAILLPILFTLQLLLSGQPLPNIQNPFTSIDHVLSLFAQPYWYAKQAAIYFEVLYTWQSLIPVVFLIFAFIGFIKKRKNATIQLLVAAFLGMIASAWLLRSWFVFPNVAAYEQGDYPLRLIKASLLFLFPCAMYGLYIVLEKIKNKKYQSFVVISSSVILMLSLYLAYPQHNQKARFPGLNVTATDASAVQWIHDQNSEYNYVVLANQLVSAAALEYYSFAHHFQTDQGELFYYSIPTGGPLYQEYGNMLYKGQKREYMEKAMSMTGAEKAYFVLNSYWADSDKIIEGAKKTADSWHVIDDGDIWIFEYTI